MLKLFSVITSNHSEKELVEAETGALVGTIVSHTLLLFYSSFFGGGGGLIDGLGMPVHC